MQHRLECFSAVSKQIGSMSSKMQLNFINLILSLFFIQTLSLYRSDSIVKACKHNSLKLLIKMDDEHHAGQMGTDTIRSIMILVSVRFHVNKNTIH